MSSEAITQNDLREILSRTVGAVPSEYKKLLWTNPNPTSAFNAQTIPLDFSNYDAIEIIIRADTANTYTLAPIVTEVGKGGIAFNSTAYNSVRQFTTTTSGITFTAATYYSSYGNWSASSTNALIPVKIYGIKYERVAPPQVEYPNYSTEEQQVGTWVDGKPIYRKVYLGLNFGGTASAWTDTGATITGVNAIVSCRGLNLSGVIQALMGFRIYNNKIQYWCAQTWSGTTCIVIEYTKTTD